MVDANLAKYVIIGDFIAKHSITKANFINAVFGQTQGLIGDNLDFKTLQSNKKLGKIVIEFIDKEKKEGIFHIPTDVTKVEVSLIAAAIETVKKIGNSEVDISIRNIEDVKSDKKNYIMNKAEEFLEVLKEDTNVVIQKLEDIRGNSAINDIIIGDTSKDEIVLVKYREDARNLIKKGFTNVVEIGKLKQVLNYRLYNILRNKILILFLSGKDRKMLNRLRDILNIDYFVITKNKEVFSLSKVEIENCLKNKSVNVFKSSFNNQVKHIFGVKKKIHKKLLEIINGNLKSQNFFLVDVNYKVIYEGMAEDFYTLTLSKKAKYIIFNGDFTTHDINNIKKNKLNIKTVYCKRNSIYVKDFKIINFDEFL